MSGPLSSRASRKRAVAWRLFDFSASGPGRKAPEHLPVVLFRDGYAADAFSTERVVGYPACIGYHNHVPFARFGCGKQHAGLVTRSFWRLLSKIILDKRP